MKLLDGRELAGFIKERQLKQFSVLWTEHHIKAKLAIIITIDDPVINLYVKLKEKYGQDLKIDIVIFRVSMVSLAPTIEKINQDDSFQGLIVQLPLKQMSEADKYLNLIDAKKDIDGLSERAIYDPATPKAILWLLAGYNVNLEIKNILVIGLGRLVGRPLVKIMQQSGLKPTVADDLTNNLPEMISQADLIITATGQPGLIKASMVKPNTIIVDAGTTSENGQIVGDLDPDVYNRSDLILTPIKGGVGPLTIAALFDNLYQTISDHFISKI